MTTLVLSILNGSSSFLHTIRTTIKAWMSLNFGKNLLLTQGFPSLLYFRSPWDSHLLFLRVLGQISRVPCVNA